MAYRGTTLDEELIRQWPRLDEGRWLRRPDTRANIEAGRLAGLLAGGDIGDGYVQVGELWVPRAAVRDPAQVNWGASGHPRGLAYELDALTRVRIALTRRPDWIAHSWSAARVWGMPYFCDDADTCVLSRGRSRPAPTPQQVSRFRGERTLATVPTRVRVDSGMPGLRTTPPILTAIHCLRSLRAGSHAWRVPDGTGLDGNELRAVQFIDAFCALSGCDPLRLVAACGDHYPQRHLAELVAMADRGAESPMETVMRLQVQRLFGEGFISQLVIRQDGTVADPVHTTDVAGRGVVARVDLGSPTLKLALQYDGSGHLERRRRDTDSRVNAALANLGWHVLRLTYGHLRDLDLLQRTVAEGIALCRRRT
ncbi:MAG: hypothetical protein ACTH2Y_10750 [Corynebacterium sp.]|uniref:hypothetical protein n=1 Tax=unclassified Corynebacterium TaxID=2624378 RepID=UPI003F8F9C83